MRQNLGDALAFSYRNIQPCLTIQVNKGEAIPWMLHCAIFRSVSLFETEWFLVMARLSESAGS